MTARVCPNCGAEFDPAGASPGSLPGTAVCPSCGQEQDPPSLPPEPEAPAGEAPAAPPSPRTPAGASAETPAGAPSGESQSLADWDAALREIRRERQGDAPPPPPPGAGWGGRRSEGEEFIRQEFSRAEEGNLPAWEGEKGGLAVRLLTTVGQMLLHPMRTMTPEGRPGYNWSLSFGIILGTLGFCAEAFWEIIAGRVDGRTTAILTMFLSPLLAALALFIGSAVTHLGMIIVGARPAGFRGTFRVMAYAESAMIFSLLPWMGHALSTIWGLVILVGGLAAAQRCSRGRALGGVIMGGLVIFGPLILFFMVLALAFGVGAALLGMAQTG